MNPPNGRLCMGDLGARRWRHALFVASLLAAGCGGNPAPPADGPGRDGGPSQPPAVVVGPAPDAAPPARGTGGPHLFRRVVLVAVGINRYEKLRGTTDLRYAEADAAEVADVCDKLYGYEVVRLTGEQATKRGVELTLKKYGRELGGEDALICFFAGHGQVIPLASGEEAGYLLPADADLDLNDKSDSGRWESQALNMQSLVDLIEGMNARHVLFIADACCSGFMTRRGSLDRADLKAFLFGRSRAVVAATTRRQRAREDGGAKHGFFTAALLGELRKNDAASTMDIYHSVQRSVASVTNATMTPQIGHVGDGDGMFVFIPKSIPKSEVESDLNGRALEDAPRQGLAGVQARERQRQAGRTGEGEVAEALAAPDYRFAVQAEDDRARWEKRFARFRENAGLGDVWAMAALHVCHERGLGTGRDPDQAYHWARQLDRFRQPAGVGRYFLGRCYHLGIGVAANEAAARELYRESADKGYLLGELALAQLRIVGREPTAADVAHAKRVFEKAVGANIDSARPLLSRLYTGVIPGTPKDVDKAVEVLTPAAERRLPEAQFLLYLIYAREASHRDPAKAERWLRSAAENGFAEAQATLGLELYQTRVDPRRLDLGLRKDVAEAVKWFELAASQHLPRAHMLLADLYEMGAGSVQPDYEKAIRHCREAAKKNHPPAFSRQCRWYFQGKVYPRDDGQALKMAQQAAELNDAEGLSYLAALYGENRVPETLLLPKDYAGGKPVYSHYAMHYFVQAASRGNPFALDTLKPGIYADDVRRNPDITYLKFFRRDFPESAKEFERLTGLKLK